MKQLSASEARLIQIEVLKAFRNMCLENNLRYSLYAGTLIGALRHKGFIPWDDDIDVAMMRDDYERFHALFADKCPINYLKLYDSRDESMFHFPFMKLADTRTLQVSPGKEQDVLELGLHIDIFAIDGMPRYRWLAIFHLLVLKFIRHCDEMSFLRIGVKGRSFVKRCVVILFKIITFGAKPPFWHRLHNKLASVYKVSDTRWAGNTVWGYAEKELVPKECYDGELQVCFENECFSAFGGADTYLRTVYGDYMKPPPGEVQLGNHVVASYMK